MTRHGIAWHGMAWHGMKRHDATQHDTTRQNKTGFSVLYLAINLRGFCQSPFNSVMAKKNT